MRVLRFLVLAASFACCEVCALSCHSLTPVPGIDVGAVGQSHTEGPSLLLSLRNNSVRTPTALEGSAGAASDLSSPSTDGMKPKENILKKVHTSLKNVHIPHPLWAWNWQEVTGAGLHAVWCSIALFAAGILCSAGGIGGGGIYVTVLMIFGGLSTYDAVPLSKSVVFLGSVVSLLLNARKMGRKDASEKARALIDYNICRLVVPSALMGTLIGVFLNRKLPDSLIVAVLVAVLLGMLVTSIRQTARQCTAEALEPDSGLHESSSPAQSTAEAPQPDSNSSPETTTNQDVLVREVVQNAECNRTTLYAGDIALSIALLLTIVFCGTARFHAEQCYRGLREGDFEVCRYPLMTPFFGHSMENMMAEEVPANMFMFIALAVPLCFASCVVLYNSKVCWRHQQWTLREVLLYDAMALGTGVLAGLVGIGGGLAFSPFFLGMGIEPAVAVATSSTCVIFTSSSTTLQYLGADRVIMTLMVVYGFVNLCASYAGTSLVHWLHEQRPGRKSYISGIVMLGLLVSTVLALAKLIDPVEE